LPILAVCSITEAEQGATPKDNWGGKMEMDYRNEIIRMVQAVCPESALKKIYKFVRMIYNSLCGAERNRA
jgi:hypothetical protein